MKRIKRSRSLSKLSLIWTSLFVGLKPAVPKYKDFLRQYAFLFLRVIIVCFHFTKKVPHVRQEEYIATCVCVYVDLSDYKSTSWEEKIERKYQLISYTVCSQLQILQYVFEFVIIKLPFYLILSSKENLSMLFLQLNTRNWFLEIMMATLLLTCLRVSTYLF